MAPVWLFASPEARALALDLDEVHARTRVAYVADAEGGVTTVELDNPTMPRIGKRAAGLVVDPRRMIVQGGYLYVADGMNMKIWILNRTTLEIVGSFGHGGRMAGELGWLHNIEMDAKGNMYAVQVTPGQRVQKFKPVAPK